MEKTLKKMRITAMREEIHAINQKSETKDIIRFHICGTTFPDKSYRIERKRSRVACIEYIESGSGTVSIDGKVFYPRAGDSYFLQEGKDQHYYSSPTDPWKKHFINVSGRLLSSLAEGYGLSDVSYFEGLDLSAELSRVIELTKRSDDCSAELVVLLNEIFLKMHGHLKNASERFGIESEMKDFLNTQITQRFDLSLLCKHIAKSESRTIHLFKNAYGVTPYAYVLGKKLELAKKLLDNTNLTVKQISEKLCFSDEYYFSSLFKNKIGVSPSVYRKKALSPTAENNGQIGV
jgi:AraC-like DNA-binding protein